MQGGLCRNFECRTYTVEEGSLDDSFQTCFLCVLIGNSRWQQLNKRSNLESDLNIFSSKIIEQLKARLKCSLWVDEGVIID